MKATYIDHMGTDLSVVNAARVSFGKQSEWEGLTHRYDDHETDYQSLEAEGWVFWEESTSGDVYRRLSKADQGLIQFLARGCTSGDWETLMHDVAYGPAAVEPLLNHIRRMPPHWSPFAHTAISLHLKMPIFVARQIMKHTTGMVYNEVSRRYVTDEPEFYVPDAWRKAADNVKQGSGEEHSDYEQTLNSQMYVDHMNHSVWAYDRMVSHGVAPEQARMVLPQSMYTEVIATGNLYSWANLFVQRTDSHAQKETQVLAHQIGEIIQPLFPVSWEALTK